MPHPITSGITRRQLLVGGAAALALAACGNGDDDSNAGSTDTGSPGDQPAGADGFPRVVESKFGPAEIPERPERVVALGWTDMDVAVALGVVPIAVTETPDVDSGLYPWLAEAVEAAGVELPERLNIFTAGIPIEVIAALRPDLILGANAYLDESYTELAEIAPVVSFVEDPWGEDWRSHAAQIAKGLGKEAELEDVLAEVDDTVAAAAAAHPELAGKTFTFTAHRETQFDLIDKPDAPVIRFMEQLGLVMPDGLADPDSAYSRSVSLENLELLDADVVIVWSDDRDGLEGQELFSRIPAVADGRHIFIDGVLAQALNSPTPLSIPYTLDQLVPSLATAAS